MKFNHINSKRIGYIFLTGIILINAGGCLYKNSNSNKNITITNTPTPKPTNTPIPVNTPTPKPTITNTPTPSLTNKDIEIINIFNDIEKEINEIIENDKQSLETVKIVFITLIDFIFFDTEINGVKFDDLTNEEKEKILNICNSIDVKIENKFPNYKETISYKTKDAYNKASELIKNGAKNINDFTKENLDEEYYNALIEAKDDIKEFSIEAWDIFKDFSISSYEKGKEYIKQWYDKFKEK